MRKALLVLVSLICLASLGAAQGAAREVPDVSDVCALPVDTGGRHEAIPCAASGTRYGYYLYTPAGYEETDASYPLLVFLHGSGERGDSLTIPKAIHDVCRNGPPRLIDLKSWNPPYPMLVVSPQCPFSDDGWEPDRVHEFITYIVGKYRVNRQRIYLTGLSMGGFGTFAYLSLGETTWAAAAIPICGGGNEGSAAEMAKTPIWAFHGEEDTTVFVYYSIDLVKAINECAPKVKAKVTIYPYVGHQSWMMTYDGSGMGKESVDYDPYDMNIYEWLFKFKKDVPSGR